ncbi:MAG TPA: GH32 C-terminal domain-containing protein, partial [Vicinamibacteria bacterium]|nr:GH32 C-terminal domain-containing protein [Vicinamibacteria bacterium]
LRGPLVAVSGRDVAELSARLAEAGLRGRALEIEAEIEPGQATEVGLSVRRGRQDETRVGYDVARRELYVDRSRSGAVAFHPAFAARHRAPLPLEDGRLRLRVLVDASSVEVFGGGGRVVLTELVFPGEGSDGVALFARGGRTGLVTVRAWRLSPAGGSSRRK